MAIDPEVLAAYVALVQAERAAQREKERQQALDAAHEEARRTKKGK